MRLGCFALAAAAFGATPAAQAGGKVAGRAGGPPAAAGAHDHGACLEPEPVLSVADFDGNGIVDAEDLREIARRVERREYAAFFDRNIDGVLDDRDVLLAAQEIGERSRPLDQELAALFRAVDRYRDQNAAIADGFIPVAENIATAGVHWARPTAGTGIDTAFMLTRPQGLLYSEGGKLLAVFYTIHVDPSRPEAAPEGFTGNEPWHAHTSVCFGGLDLENPSYDPESLRFRECIPQAECIGKQPGPSAGPLKAVRGAWVPGFHMLHVWLYELSSCGTFAFENPRVTGGRPHGVSRERCPGGAGQAAPGHEH